MDSVQGILSSAIVDVMGHNQPHINIGSVVTEKLVRDVVDTAVYKEIDEEIAEKTTRT